MDFDAAIAAHARWKYRLSDHVDGKSTEQLDPAVVGCDDKCDLGKWIHSTSGGSAVFSDLKREHAEFHQHAAAIVRKSKEGKKSEALDMLANDAVYATCSFKVIALIKTMRDATK